MPARWPRTSRPAGPRPLRPCPGRGIRLAGAPARRLRAALLLSALAAGPAFAPAAAQELEPNPLLTLRFSSALNVSDNYNLSAEKPGTSTFLDNTLGLNYQSETVSQLLNFDLSGVARLADLPRTGSEADFDNERLSFGYRRLGADSEFGVNARYNHADLAFFDPLLDDIEDLDEQDLAPSRDGTREFWQAGVDLAVGTASPVGFTLSALTQRRNFSGLDAGSSYYDTETHSLSGSLNLAVSPVSRVFLSGELRDYSADNLSDLDRLSRSASLGLAQEWARGLTFNGALGYQKIESKQTDEFGNRITTINDGATGSLGLVQELPDGQIGLSLTHSVTTSGGRTAVMLDRGLDLPEGQLALSIGLSRGEVGRNSVIGSIAYDHDLPRGSISLGLARSIRTNDDNGESEVTRASLGWDHDLTAVSGIGLSAQYVSIRALDAGSDRDRGRVEASYRHQLTEDWGLTGGYRYAFSEGENVADANESSVFLRIGRDFRMRPW